MTDSKEGVSKRLAKYEKLAEEIGKLRELSHEDLLIFVAARIHELEDTTRELFEEKVEADTLRAKYRKLLDELDKERKRKGAAT